MKEDTTPIDPTWMEKTGGFAKDMTMRDHFAGLIMQALIGRETKFNLDAMLYTGAAYDMADAMLEARDGK
jgi:hypothetical protein